MPSIYTKQGDQGDTGILGEGRFPKFDTRFDALGALDEATAALGIARTQCPDEHTVDRIIHLQKDLYQVMTEISCSAETAQSFLKIDDEKITWLEDQIEQITAITGSPKDFILPGEVSSSAYLSLARAIIRRAERKVAALNAEGNLHNQKIPRYLNRASSFCFALELYQNHIQGVQTRKIKDL